jgi:hypothetical protein
MTVDANALGEPGGDADAAGGGLLGATSDDDGLVVRRLAATVEL